VPQITSIVQNPVAQTPEIKLPEVAKPELHNNDITPTEAAKPEEVAELNVSPAAEITPTMEETETEKAKEERPKAVIELIGTTTLTSESLEGIISDGGNVEVVVADGVVWDIDLSGVDVSELNIDMNVVVGEANIPEAALDKLVDSDEDVVLMTLAHDGPFGFYAVLNVEIGEEHNGKYANLYYFNPETGEFELVDSVLVSGDGLAAFNMKHASEYAITFSDKQQMVKNGANTMLMMLLIVILIGGVVVLGIVIFRVYAVKPEDDFYFDNEDNSLD